MTRRRRRAAPRAPLALVGAILACAVALTLFHLAGWLAITAAIGAGGYALGRRSRALPGKPATPAVRQATPAVRQADPASARARRNGWQRPAQSTLYSAECATAESAPDHQFCFDPRCQCPCGHPQNAPAVAPAPLPDKPPF
jgi:hypothetical protein